jgi:NAD(P)-dependent dehydrogenase (short-subunit alcohol dehydrogenase family)
MTTTGYGFETTTDELLADRDLSGRRVLITGGTAGLGLETARALAASGAHVVMTARNATKGEHAAAVVREAATRGAGVEVRELDLESLASVRACADRLLDEDHTIDVLFANAGVMACPPGRTREGFETQIGTNHIGHFVLVNKLAPLIARSPGGGRVVVTSSAGHRFADVDLDDPNFERRPYDAWVAYGRSKTANVLYAVELDRRLGGRGVRACAVHPGAINTELARHLTPDTLAVMKKIIDDAGGLGVVKFKSIPQGAATQVWAGIVGDPSLTGGRFCEDCAVARVDDGANPIGGVRSYALDANRARALWTRTEEWAKEPFPLGE